MLVNFCTDNKMKRQSKRAFTVAETVVAMAIIVMITAVGITSCVVALKIQNNAVNTEKAYTVCDEIVSAFYQAIVVNGSFNSVEFVKRANFALGTSDVLQQSENVYSYKAKDIDIVATVSNDGKQISVVGKVVGLSKSVYNRAYTVENGVLTEVRV